MLTACGSSSDSMTSSSYDSVASESYNGNYGNTVKVSGFNTSSSTKSEEMVETFETEDMTESNIETTNKTKNELSVEKLVYQCDLSVETLNYDDTIDRLNSLIDKYDILISSEDESDDNGVIAYRDNERTGTRRNKLQLRIPSNNYHAFLDEYSELEVVRSKSQSVRNITAEYYDTKTEISSLRAQEQRLLEMYNECYTIEDMITVEKRLTEVQSELSQLQSNLNYMDMDVAYSYVNITIKEVIEYSTISEPVKTSTFFDRLKNTVSETIEFTLSFLEFVLFMIIRLLPFILMVVIIVVIIVAIVKKKSNKNINKDKIVNTKGDLEN